MNKSKYTFCLRDDEDIPSVRIKSKRNRIKEHRAKRDRRRFYEIINGKERARDTGVRNGSYKKCLLSNSK